MESHRFRCNAQVVAQLSLTRAAMHSTMRMAVRTTLRSIDEAASAVNPTSNKSPKLYSEGVVRAAEYMHDVEYTARCRVRI
jgi:hypothetical protein